MPVTGLGTSRAAALKLAVWRQDIVAVPGRSPSSHDPAPTRVATQYSSNETVGKELGLAWDVRATLSDSLGLEWALRSATGDALVIVWDVEGRPDPTRFVLSTLEPASRTREAAPRGGGGA
jgi:hypothetical protein